MSMSCNVCGKRAYSDYCVAHKPRKPIINKKTINRTGKHYALWNECRRDWIQKHATLSGTWPCHYCKTLLTVNTLTLDHKLTRAQRPDLRYDHSNLLPCCIFDNNRRGSMTYEAYIEKYY